jgi:hypothetical protein
VNNGLSGNPHFATKAIGKDLAEIGVTNTVNQVRASGRAEIRIDDGSRIDRVVTVGCCTCGHANQSALRCLEAQARDTAG